MNDNIDNCHILIFNEGLKILSDDFESKIKDKDLLKIYHKGLNKYRNKLEESFNIPELPNIFLVKQNRITSPLALNIISIDEIKQWEDEKLRKSNNAGFKICTDFKENKYFEDTYNIAKTNTYNIREEMRRRGMYNDKV